MKAGSSDCSLTAGLQGSNVQGSLHRGGSENYGLIIWWAIEGVTETEELESDL